MICVQMSLPQHERLLLQALLLLLSLLPQHEAFLLLLPLLPLLLLLQQEILTFCKGLHENVLLVV